jgi:hypothetical protein
MLIRGRVSVKYVARQMRVCVRGSSIQHRFSHLVLAESNLTLSPTVTMAAFVPTKFAPNSVQELKALLHGDNKVKVAGRVIMCMHRPVLTDLLTQVLTVSLRSDHIF